MIKVLRILIIGIALAMAVSAIAEIDSRAFEIRDSLEQALTRVQSPDERMLMLYNIFDLSKDMKHRDSALRRLYEEAGKADKSEVQLDVLTHLANIHRDNDTILVGIEHELEKFTDTDLKREVKLFVAMSRVDLISKRDSNSENNDHLNILFKRESISPSTDPYERALMLYTLCVHLGKTTRGELLEEYLQRLERQIDSMHLPAGSVRNLIYTRSAPVFTNNQNVKKAVEIDKR